MNYHEIESPVIDSLDQLPVSCQWLDECVAHQLDLAQANIRLGLRFHEGRLKLTIRAKQEPEPLPDCLRCTGGYCYADDQQITLCPDPECPAQAELLRRHNDFYGLAPEANSA